MLTLREATLPSVGLRCPPNLDTRSIASYSSRRLGSSRGRRTSWRQRDPAEERVLRPESQSP